MSTSEERTKEQSVSGDCLKVQMAIEKQILREESLDEQEKKLLKEHLDGCEECKVFAKAVDVMREVPPVSSDQMADIKKDDVVYDGDLPKNTEEALKQAIQIAEARANSLVKLNRFAEAINSTLDLKEILEIICQEMVDIFDARNTGTPR